MAGEIVPPPPPISPRYAALALLLSFATPAIAQVDSPTKQATQLIQKGRRAEAIALLEKSPAQDGGAHYLLAALLAEERRGGRVCQSDAYRSTILQRLNEAIEVDAAFKQKALTDGRFAVVHDTMGWQQLLGRSPAQLADVPELLRRVSFHGPSQGMYGSNAMLDFQFQGQVRGWRSVWDDKLDGPKRVSVRGSYRVEGRTVTITFGKEIWHGKLGTDGTLEIEGQGTFIDEPSECDA